MIDRKEQFEKSRFPASVFIVYLLVLFLMSGVHVGLIVWMNKVEFNAVIQCIIPMVYWAVVAGGITLFTRNKIKKTYEEPMRNLAEATMKVAAGDFSVYVPTIHTSDKLDYLDHMILDFNKMVEELGSIETMKVDFFSNVSHEIKTPLSVIQNNAELLQKATLDEKQQQECLSNIQTATKRLSSLINNMLKLNKLEKQVIRPASQEFDLPAQLCECALQFESIWEKKDIEFEADIDDRFMLWSDPGLLEMVWTNLISNAMKFTPEGGQVKLSQTVDEETVAVTVEDTGCGMDSETVKHIYDKFYQGDTSHATEGNGLGLALVHRILQLLGGSITVESQPGEGTRFTVKLPVIKENENAEN